MKISFIWVDARGSAIDMTDVKGVELEETIEIFPSLPGYVIKGPGLINGFSPGRPEVAGVHITIRKDTDDD